MSFGLYNAPSTFQCYMTIFMDDFTMYATSFDACQENLSRVLTRCMDTNFVLNFEKCHFMVTEGIRLGHLVSKVDIITSLPNLAFVGEDVDFNFDQPYVEPFQELKTRLTSAPILQAPN
ncbi:Retrovirus-related Pol polyprotein, partial [Mucuna pruriens]